MISRPLAVGLFAAGCLTAAGAGAFVAVRQNTTTAVTVPSAAAAPIAPAPQAVTETEAIVEPVVEQPKKEAPAAEPDRPRRQRQVSPRRPTPAVTRAAAPPPVQVTPEAATGVHEAANEPVPTTPALPEPPVTAALPSVLPDQPAAPAPEPRIDTPSASQLEEITLPASAVIGLEVETTVTSERARVEDRVDARVTRDVYADGRLAIPAGARIIGSVTVVDRGGKVKERARLGVRFHTLVLADGRRIDVRTDTIFREGQSPAGESSRKIGGAAVGGAVLGAIMGGRKGALLGGAAGAAGGTAAVMAGGRNAATLNAGTVVTARLASPVTIDVERR